MKLRKRRECTNGGEACAKAGEAACVVNGVRLCLRTSIAVRDNEDVDISRPPGGCSQHPVPRGLAGYEGAD